MSLDQESSTERSLFPFKLESAMRIGAAISTNYKSLIDEFVCRLGSYCALQALGINENFWDAQEKQAGLQGGQYLIAAYSQTWKKYLEPPSNIAFFNSLATGA
jgi:hypothetical protein